MVTPLSLARKPTAGPAMRFNILITLPACQVSWIPVASMPDTQVPAVATETMTVTVMMPIRIVYSAW